MQFAQRLLRYLTVKDLGLLPADDGLGVCDAMNARIQEYYHLVPTAYKGTTFEATLLPATTITATFTNGTNTWTGWSATTQQKGFTIVAGTDQRQNTIIGANQMLDIYTGPTGTFTALVYGDIIRMENVIERLTNDPILVDYNRALVRDENWRNRAVRGVWPGSVSNFVYGSYSVRQIRTPYKYWVERQGESQGAFPPFMLRMDSLPDVEYRVRVEGLLAPIQTQWTDLSTPVELPLDHYIIESMVLPLAVYHLSEHPLWADKSNLARVKEKYAIARKQAEERVQDLASSDNLCGTPRGW